MKTSRALALLFFVSACGGKVFVEGADENEPVTIEPCDPGYEPRAQDCATPEDETCGFAAPTCSGTTQWVFGGVGGSSGGYDVAFTPDGGTVVVGYVEGDVQFGGTSVSIDEPSALIAKLSVDGELEWLLTADSAEPSGAGAVEVDGDGVITVTGSHSGAMSLGGTALPAAGSVFVAQLEPDGQLRWARSYGDGQAAPVDLAARPGGGFVVAGHLYGSTTLGTGTLPFAGKQDVFVMSLDPAGEPRWARAFGSGAPDRVSRMAVDAKGRIALAGSFDGSLSLGDGQLPLIHQGNNDGYVVQLDDTGTVRYAGQLAGSGSDIAASIAFTAAGEMLVAGSLTSQDASTPTGPHATLGPASLYLGRLAANGAALGDDVLGGAQTSVYPRDLNVDSAGQALLLGHFEGPLDLGDGPQSTAEGSQSLFIAKRDPELGPIWSHAFGDAELQRPRRLDQDPFGGMVITGDYRGALDFGPGLVLPEPPGVEYQLFVARFSP